MRHPALIPLSHDHHHGLALALRCRKQALGQLKPMGLKGLKERTQELRDFFANNLVVHFRAEEEVLLPKLRELMPESAAIVDQLVHEHQQLRDAVAQLDTDAGLSKLVFNFGDLLENKRQTGHKRVNKRVINKRVKSFVASCWLLLNVPSHIAPDGIHFAEL